MKSSRRDWMSWNMKNASCTKIMCYKSIIVYIRQHVSRTTCFHFCEAINIQSKSIASNQRSGASGDDRLNHDQASVQFELAMTSEWPILLDERKIFVPLASSFSVNCVRDQSFTEKVHFVCDDILHWRDCYIYFEHEHGRFEAKKI